MHQFLRIKDQLLLELFPLENFKSEKCPVTSKKTSQEVTTSAGDWEAIT